LKNELQYVISVRLEELANELSKRNSVHGNLVDARLDGDVLSLYLKPLDRDTASSALYECRRTFNRLGRYLGPLLEKWMGPNECKSSV
jgi:hypothetical protein